jgi:hypothetical protein
MPARTLCTLSSLINLILYLSPYLSGLYMLSTQGGVPDIRARRFPCRHILSALRLKIFLRRHTTIPAPQRSYGLITNFESFQGVPCVTKS